jgi:hypothetical protein
VKFVTIDIPLLSKVKLLTIQAVLTALPALSKEKKLLELDRNHKKAGTWSKIQWKNTSTPIQFSAVINSRCSTDLAKAPYSLGYYCSVICGKMDPAQNN